MPGTLTITQAAGAIAITSSPTPNFGSTYTVTYSNLSGGVIHLTSSDPSVCQVISATTVTFIKVGDCTLTPSVDATNDYVGATGVAQLITVVPVAPYAPVITSVVPSNAQATVSWTADAFTGGEPLTGYIVRYSTDGLSWTTATMCTGLTTSCVVTGLTNAVPYTFEVNATNAASLTSNWSAGSNYAVPYTVANAPASVNATSYHSGTSTVSWTVPSFDGGSSITGYTVAVAPSTGITVPNACVNTLNLTCTFTGLSNGTTYTFSVVATNAAGASASTSATAVPAAAPAAPASVTPVSYQNQQVTVNWTAPSTTNGDAVTGYSVSIAPSTGVTIPTSCTNTLNLSCVITGLTNGSTYTFSVTATNHAGTSPATSGTASPATTASAPATVSATTGDDTKSTVTWSTPTSDGGAAITSYLITVQGTVGTPSNGGTCAADFSGITGANTVCGKYNVENQSVTLTAPAGSVFNAVTYAFYGTATINGSGIPTASSCNASSALGIVTNLLVGKNSATFTEGNALFGDPCSGTVKHFYIVATYTPLSWTVAAPANSYTITGLMNGASYTFQVAAINAAGTGTATAATAIVPLGTPTTPSISNAPTNAQYGQSFTATVATTGDGTKSVTSTTTSVCTTTGMVVKFVGIGTCTLTVAVAQGPTFHAGTATQSITVAVAPMTVTATTPNVTYGTAVAPSYSAPALVSPDVLVVTYTYVGVAPTVYNATTAPTQAGSYTVTPSETFSTGTAANYQITNTAETLVIAQKALTITTTTPNVTYGTAITPSYSAPALVSPDAIAVTYTYVGVSPVVYNATTAPTQAGSYTVTPSETFSTGTAANYVITNTPETLVIAQKALSITASSTSVVYGSAVPSVTPTYSGFITGESSADLTGTTTCDSGTTTTSHVSIYVSTCTGVTSKNYAITFVPGTTTITKAPLTITASAAVSGATQVAATQVYGAAAPTIIALYSGFVLTDTSRNLTVLPVCISGTTSASHVGTYTASCSSAQSGDYSFTYVADTTSVTKAPLVITASSVTQPYLSTPPVITPNYTGFVNGDGASSLSAPPTCSGTSTSASLVSASPFVSSCVGATAHDYTITYVAGIVTIVPIAPTTPRITNLAVNALYGGSFTPSIDSNSDGVTSVISSTPLVCTVNTTTDLVSFVGPGTCSLNAHSAAGSNYVVAAGTAQTFTVAKAPLTITGPSATIIIGSAAPAMTALYTGFVAGDSASSLTTRATCLTYASAYAGVGVYATTCSGATSPNYAITYVAGAVTIILDTPTTPVITNLPSIDAVGNTYTPTVSTNGDGAKGFISVTPAVCSVAGGVVTYLLVGTCTLKATVGVGAHYNTATGLGQDIPVSNPLTSADLVYAVTNWWIGGYQSSVTLTNKATINVGSGAHPWQFAFVLPTGTAISNLWGASYVTAATTGGTLVTVTGPSYFPLLKPGQSYQIGFTTTGNADAGNCIMGGQLCSMPSPLIPAISTANVTYRVASWTPAGYHAEFTIINPTSAPVGTVAAPWSLQFVLPTGTTLSSSWGATTTTAPTTGGTLVTMTAPTSAPSIAPGLSVSAGFTTTGSGAATNCAMGGQSCESSPSAPTNAVATTSSASATVSWTPSTTAGASTVTSYEVTTVGSFQTCTISANVGTQCTVTGLVNGTSYTFVVRAINGLGVSSSLSPASNAVTPFGAPDSPTGVTATAGDGQSVIRWTAPSGLGGSTIAGYTVTASPSITAPASCTNTTALTCTFTGLTNGVSYTFTVTATTAAGFTSSASSSSNVAQPLTPPSAPSTVVANAGDGQATVTWTASTSGGTSIADYVVTALPGGINCTASQAHGVVTSCVVVGLTNGVSYTFTVQALTSDQRTSAASAASVAVTPFGAPSAPSYVHAVEGNGQATVTWTVPAQNGGSSNLRYTLSASPSVTIPAACQATSATSCVVTGLTNGVAYTFTVTATTAGGTSSASPASKAVRPQATTQSGALHYLFVKKMLSRTSYQGHFTISNPTNTAIGTRVLPWSFSFKLPSGTTLSSLWGATYTSSSAGGVTTVVVTAMKSAPSVAAGKYAVVYFTTKGKGAAYGCVAGGNACVAH